MESLADWLEALYDTVHVSELSYLSETVRPIISEKILNSLRVIISKFYFCKCGNVAAF